MLYFSPRQWWTAKLAVLICLLVPLTGHTESSEQATKPMVGSGAHLLNMALGLVLIIVLILVLAWFLRRFSPGGVFGNQKAIKIVATMPLGTRERLMVVDVAGQQILLGVTAREINTLHVFETPVIDPTQVPQQSEFSRKLMAALQKKDQGGGR